MSAKIKQAKISEIQALIKSKELDSAWRSAEALLKIDRSAGLACLGIVAFHQTKFNDAEKFLLESYRINSNQYVALMNLVSVYIKLKEPKKAITFGELYLKHIQEKSLSVDPLTIIGLGAAYSQDQRNDDCINTILSLDSSVIENNYSALITLAAACRPTYRTEQGLAYLKILRDKFPERIPDIDKLQADYDSDADPYLSLSRYRTLVEDSPDHVALRWNYSLMQLRVHDFEGGWVNYDNGLTKEVGKIGKPLPPMLYNFKLCLSKSDLDSKKWTILVCEQGIGDQVLFLSSLNDFLKDFPKSVILCESRMAPIISRSFPQISCLLYGLGRVINFKNENLNGILPIGSYQKFYRNNISNYTNSRSNFLIPNHDLKSSYRNVLLEKAQGKKIVGVSWKGGFWERAVKSKSIELELWKSVFDRDDIFFVSLQYGDTSKEERYAKQYYPNLHFVKGIDFKKEIDKWFSLITACDSILSVSTAMVHFAAAAGMHVDLILSDRGNPFIWGIEDKKGLPYLDVNIHRKGRKTSVDVFMKKIAKAI